MAVTTAATQRRTYDALAKQIQKHYDDIEALIADQRAIVMSHVAKRFGITIGSRVFVYGGSSRSMKEYYVVTRIDVSGWPYSKPGARGKKIKANKQIGTYEHDLRNWWHKVEGA